MFLIPTDNCHFCIFKRQSSKRIMCKYAGVWCRHMSLSLWCCQALWRRLLTCEVFLKRRKCKKKGRPESTRNRWPCGQEELPSLQLVLVVKHHGIHPGYRTILKRGKRETGKIRLVDWLWRPSVSREIMQKEAGERQREYSHFQSKIH